MDSICRQASKRTAEADESVPLTGSSPKKPDMNAVDLIAKKRDGGEHSRNELRFLMEGVVGEKIPDYQLAAWAMAVYFQGMTPAEATALTQAMAASGETLDLQGLAPAGQLIVDKHSSGGVGDKTTLTVGPIVAGVRAAGREDERAGPQLFGGNNR